MDRFMFAAGMLGITLVQVNIRPQLVGTFTRTAQIMGVDIDRTVIITSRRPL